MRRLPSGGSAGRGFVGRALIEWALVGALTSALVVWLSLAAATARPDNMIYDAWMRMRAGPTSEQIVIVAIDNRSLEALGRWPWPRQVHADLIDRLAQAQASAVGYDVLFVEASDQGDADLARAISAAGNVYLPMLVDPVGENGAPWQATEPIPELRDAAAGLGHVNLVVDDDGVVRRMPLYLSAGQPSWPHLAAQLARTVNPDIGGDVPPRSQSSDLLTGKGAVLVNYRGPPGQFRTASFVDLLRGETPAAFLTGKLVLVGMTADGQGDRYATPTTGEGQLTPGVEIQASLVDTLLRHDAITPTAPLWGALLSLIPLWLLMGALLLLRPLWSLIAGAGLALMVLAISAAAFWFGVWFPPLAAMTGLALAYPLWSWRRLAAASAYMQIEVEAFARSGPAPRVVNALAGGDVVARQVETLRTAVSDLRDLERFISDVLHSLPDATLVVGEAGAVVMANAQAQALFGRDDLVGAPLTILLKAIGGLGSEGLGAEESAEPVEIATPAGRRVFVSAAPLVDANGVAQGRIVRLADMTEFRLAERQREQALQLLSHDMRAPQVSILTLLSGPHDRGDPAFERRIADNARLTLTLAEGYVQLARAESQVLGDAVFDLSQALLDAADTLWPQASQKGVRIEADADANGLEPLVRGDQGLITRVLMNLIDNAIKFSPADSVVECAVTAGERAGAPVWVCTVRDHGEGMSADTQARLFEPFSKGETDRPGAGLGLAFARAVVERHGGDIGCESAPGAGALFTLRLPQSVET
ncbi:CHASE2 domain-containing sensor protein/signal transduction histidine kinase [Brevundimonas nasdae]|uniref:CHASE2 domain-containing protein n=1 Tax=Brevundimonas nasdae TaxID=172043 RepID=UPI001911D946|nr:CHASE2 domain-containing protein [Brevundimonas nasdae]MBK6025463.1 CHASE2 domain-containing protein [Brevundimonas nasdae]MDQ0452094.1 CHASE2 domain-containing sensor protein/signal transduction histidine kinase [Brevundimonas nasdae]